MTLPLADAPAKGRLAYPLAGTSAKGACANQRRLPLAEGRLKPSTYTCQGQGHLKVPALDRTLKEGDVGW